MTDSSREIQGPPFRVVVAHTQEDILWKRRFARPVPTLSSVNAQGLHAYTCLRTSTPSMGELPIWGHNQNHVMRRSQQKSRYVNGNLAGGSEIRVPQVGNENPRNVRSLSMLSSPRACFVFVGMNTYWALNISRPEFVWGWRSNVSHSLWSIQVCSANDLYPMWNDKRSGTLSRIMGISYASSRGQRACYMVSICVHARLRGMVAVFYIRPFWILALDGSCCTLSRIYDNIYNRKLASSGQTGW